MCIILHHCPHAHQTMQRARCFITVTAAKFRHSERQVTIAFQTLIKNLYMTWTIHRLNRKCTLIVIIKRKHIVAKLIPMSRLFPKLTVDQHRCFYLGIAACTNLTTDIFLQQTIERPALIMPKDLTNRLFLNMKKIKLLTKFTMITLFRLFQHMQMRFQLLLICKRNPINTLQHLIIRISTPIRTCHLCQLKMFGNLR